eukprot:5052114-Pleurochrysis_carterae.AAC.1
MRAATGICVWVRAAPYIPEVTDPREPSMTADTKRLAPAAGAEAAFSTCAMRCRGSSRILETSQKYPAVPFSTRRGLTLLRSACRASLEVWSTPCVGGVHENAPEILPDVQRSIVFLSGKSGHHAVLLGCAGGGGDTSVAVVVKQWQRLPKQLLQEHCDRQKAPKPEYYTKQARRVFEPPRSSVFLRQPYMLMPVVCNRM